MAGPGSEGIAWADEPVSFALLGAAGASIDFGSALSIPLTETAVREAADIGESRSLPTPRICKYTTPRTCKYTPPCTCKYTPPRTVSTRYAVESGLNLVHGATSSGIDVD